MSGYLDELRKETVIVSLKSSTEGFKGVLWGVYSDGILLMDPLLQGESESVALKGSVFILRDNIEYLQVVSGAA